MSAKPRILIICDYYLPGFESGGAARTLANLVERLGGRYEFLIITRDHDGTAVRTPYTTVERGAWNKMGNTRVFYLRPDQIRARVIGQLVKEARPAAVYLNSFFSRLTIFYLALVKLRQVPVTPVILAPEGEFSPGALSLRPFKKSVYINAARPILISNRYLWKAASTEEHDDITRVIGDAADIKIAPNMPPKTIFPDYCNEAKPEKPAGSARMIFLSRFMRKKNFNWLLEQLTTVTGKLSIDIYGTLEEADYVEEFQRLNSLTPPNVTVSLKGPVPHDQVAETLFRYHFFVLPTLGENFGHVFIEALAAGCPLIVSDRTPWRDLVERNAGWDIPLEQPKRWLSVISECIAMPDDEYQRLAAGARNFAETWLANPAIEASNVEIIETAIDR